MSKPLAILYYSNLMPGGRLGNWLQDLGYRVQMLPNLPRLTEVCQREKPLVVVAEIIPGGLACVAISQMRSNPDTRHIPVLAYSKAQDAAQQAEATAAGVTLLAGNVAIVEHFPRLLEQVLQVE
jgi:PleD family two-component response regulator